MKRTTLFLILGGLVVAGLLMVTYRSILSTFLPHWEDFSATPYWDYRQWSWGYGTRVPGSIDDPNENPGGEISRAQAMADLLKHVQADYNYLRSLITRPLSAGKWAAYLSFSYNLGTGNADNLVTNINSGDDAALETQWKKYVYAGGQVNSDLVARRAAEWDLWASS